MTEPLPLPPLPEPDGEARGTRFHTEWQIRDYARAYGLACRNAALEEAAGACESMQDAAFAHANLLAHRIRKLKG